MKNNSLIHILGLLSVVLPSVLFSPAMAEIFSVGDFTLTGDVRLRIESDFDSVQADGTPRDDRTRARLRTRLQAAYQLNDAIETKISLRFSGKNAQQGAHFTFMDFDNNRRGNAAPVLYQWFIRAKRDGFTVWAGRNDFPFFQQNELLWDNDASIAGAFMSKVLPLGSNSSLSLRAGYFTVPSGGRSFAGEMAAGQALFSSKLGDVGLKAAVGVFGIEASPNDPDSLLFVEGNGARDYTLLVGNLQIAIPVGGRALKFGTDLFANQKNYLNDTDPFTVANAGEKDGFVLSALYGGLKEPGGWLLGYYYVRIEQFAVNNSFSQDDWVRFGVRGQSRGSNIKGHEFRFGYAFNKSVNVVARLYLVDAITTTEDGNRFRVDFNVKI